MYITVGKNYILHHRVAPQLHRFHVTNFFHDFLMMTAAIAFEP
jgi:hypothetical protein